VPATFKLKAVVAFSIVFLSSSSAAPSSFSVHSFLGRCPCRAIKTNALFDRSLFLCLEFFWFLLLLLLLVGVVVDFVVVVVGGFSSSFQLIKLLTATVPLSPTIPLPLAHTLRKKLFLSIRYIDFKASKS